MSARIFPAIAALVFLLSGMACADSMPPEPWRAPAKGVVQDPRAAITIAHAVWLSMNPETNETTGDETAWQGFMTATLDKGVWQVIQKDGQGLVFNIAQRDGRIVEIYIVK